MFDKVMLVATLLIVALPELPPERTRQPGLAASVSGPSTVVLHEPVILQINLRNQSTTALTLDLGFNRQAGFEIQIQTPDGTVHKPRVPERGVGRVGQIVIGAGTDFSHQLLVNDWMSFEQPGIYDIAIRLANPVLTAEGGAPKSRMRWRSNCSSVPAKNPCYSGLVNASPKP